ncbi:hypothetical protein T492DRAFT_186444, partial [Pavlovales sp. CCMP2436]
PSREQVDKSVGRTRTPPRRPRLPRVLNHGQLRPPVRDALQDRRRRPHGGYGGSRDRRRHGFICRRNARRPPQHGAQRHAARWHAPRRPTRRYGHGADGARRALGRLLRRGPWLGARAAHSWCCLSQHPGLGAGPPGPVPRAPRRGRGHGCLHQRLPAYFRIFLLSAPPPLKATPRLFVLHLQSHYVSQRVVDCRVPDQP